MTYTYKTQGTCSSNIELNVEDGIVKEVAFWPVRPGVPRGATPRGGTGPRN